MNKALVQSQLLFVPLAIVLANMSFVFELVGQDERVSTVAQRFIWATLPHLLFSQIAEIYKHQLNCYRLTFTQMLA